MDWLSNNWIFVALMVCVVILLAVFGRRGGGKHAYGAGGCCGGVERGKQEGDAPAPHGHGH